MHDKPQSASYPSVVLCQQDWGGHGGVIYMKYFTVIFIIYSVNRTGVDMEESYIYEILRSDIYHLFCQQDWGEHGGVIYMKYFRVIFIIYSVNRTGVDMEKSYI